MPSKNKDESESGNGFAFCCDLDNCGKRAKKANFAQQTSVIAAARGGAAAVEGELLRQGEKTVLSAE